MLALRRPAALLLPGVAFFGASWLGLAGAQSPPAAPTFAYIYGQALINGQNLTPEVQPVIAFVNGQSCGAPATTLVATEGDDVPEEDVGRTVYVIDVLADGTDNYERPGCGEAGDPVVLYFPASGRISTDQPIFQSGPIRADLDLDVALDNRAGLPSLASDGTN
jgi:hypothetical protein